MTEYHFDETGFTLLEGELGWQWQETGADGWSPIYSTRQAAIDAITAEFPMVPWSLPV